jgi:hypothetical protein
MFKRYDDVRHWGLFIPVGFRRYMQRLDPVTDLVTFGYYGMHFCITLKVFYFPTMRLREYRLRMGMQRL